MNLSAATLTWYSTLLSAPPSMYSRAIEIVPSRWNAP